MKGKKMTTKTMYDKPFYVDVGTSVAAIRCASNHDIVDGLDHNGSKYAIEIVERTCDLMNQEAERFYAHTGNASAMREALSDACYAMFNFLKTQNGGYEEMANALDKAKAALSKPPRNCDVGTAEAQGRRFALFCLSASNCRKCQIHELQCKTPHRPPCAIRWAQMPYEEGGAK